MTRTCKDYGNCYSTYRRTYEFVLERS